MVFKCAPPMPRTTGNVEKPPKTIEYLGTFIYTSLKRHSWRVIMKPPDYASEKRFSFGTDPAATWARVIAAIRESKK